MLPETLIRPWPSKEEFKQAFIGFKVPDDDYAIAMKNLAKKDIKVLVKEYKMDGNMNYRNFIDLKIDKLYYNGQLPPNKLLDPSAWAQFFKAWGNGDFKKKK